MSLLHEESVLAYTCNVYMIDLIPVKLDRSLHWILIGAAIGSQYLSKPEVSSPWDDLYSMNAYHIF